MEFVGKRGIHPGLSSRNYVWGDVFVCESANQPVLNVG